MKPLLFPGGKPKALTLSYDDGVTQDRRLLEILNRYQIKCTFNINSGLFGRKATHIGVSHERFEADEIAELYQGHEVAMHTSTHPNLPGMELDEMLREVMKDREVLESLVGYPVDGFAYPCGLYDTEVIDLLRALGVKYARTVLETESFALPYELLEWKSTCHHTNPRLSELADAFLSSDASGLFYLWGHSYEFDAGKNWDRIEDFCKKMAGHDDVWYATNVEIADYITAYRSLVWGDKMICNPSGTDVTIIANGNTITIPARGSVRQ